MADIDGIEQNYIQLKYGLAFSKLLVENKKIKTRNEKNNIEDFNLNHSLGKISSDTGLRVATLSDIFSGKSNPKGVTIELILKSLGKTLSQFAKYYDNFEEDDINNFKAKLDSLKIKKRKKGSRKSK